MNADAAKAAANDNYGVPALAARLIESGADRAILVSPEGDAGAAASVALSRGRWRARGCGQCWSICRPTAPLPGACWRTPIAPASRICCRVLVLFRCDLSDTLTAAHVIPTGIADPERAKRAFDRLPIILDSLVSAYDIVVVECGPTDAEALKRVAGTGSRIVLSVVDPKAPEIVETAEKLVDGGFEDLMLVTAAAVGEEPLPPEPRRAYRPLRRRSSAAAERACGFSLTAFQSWGLDLIARTALARRAAVAAIIRPAELSGITVSRCHVSISHQPRL
jgi:hypothetical protein